ncbi:AAA family ATPase [Romboutsia sp. 1001216sp1]|uniref:AAA family ATPase n=1 Tax=unclassified Romboutsia TaxID=2626894 RepID=UPI0018A93BC5|nr:AAA family ATPase [Romboutsia sp. 1001216sp1]MDB8794616.1 AAA family ATPase [Romboutsia sp. 1001216sp1]MDB8796570.1 AAA family ATPase [Romboutsia sp. 1001216sp1]MDB8798048.1 AAA family ATPase [Romboutsia sp. 1001216sp1]
MNNIFIKSIDIKELRHLKDIRIDIDEDEKKHLIITGKNGSGKSTLLEAVKDYLKSIEDKWYDNRIKASGEVKRIKQNIAQIENNSSISNDEKVRIINNYEKNLENHMHFIRKYGNWVDLDIFKNELIQNIYRKGEFIFSYFGAKRNSDVIIPKGVDKVKLSEQYKIDTKPAKEFLKYLVDLKTQQSFAITEGEPEEAEKIGSWFKSFESSLKELMNEPNLKLKFDYKNYNFNIIEDNKEPYGFNELSDGYSAVLDIVMDLIMRMEKKASRSYDLEGIVLIDEVETHLHISLQKKIMPFLTSLFPNIQFIVTTHSPFVLNSINDAVIYDLEKKIKVEDLSGYSYEGIVESYFGVDKYSQEIKEKLNRYETLINKENKNDDDLEEMYDLRQYFKTIPKSVSPEFRSKFLELEMIRKSENYKTDDKQIGMNIGPRLLSSIDLINEPIEDSKIRNMEIND